MTNELEINLVQLPTSPRAHRNSFHPNNAVQESEFFSAATRKTNLYKLTKFYNQVFRFAFDIIYFILLVCTLTMAPLLGGAVAFVDFLCTIIRIIIRPFGKVFADLFGYGTYLRVRTIQIQQEINL